MTKTKLWKEKFILSNGFRWKVHDRQGCMVAGNIRKLRVHIFDHTQEAESANGKWGEAIKLSKLSIVTCFLQQDYTFLKVL